MKINFVKWARLIATILLVIEIGMFSFMAGFMHNNAPNTTISVIAWYIPASYVEAIIKTVFLCYVAFGRWDKKLK
jgi:hypothetical protein